GASSDTLRALTSRRTKMGSPRVASRFLLCALAGLGGAASCGYSEDEMQAKIREMDGLRTQLTAEQERNKKSKAELDEFAAQIEQQKQKLKSCGLDIANLNETVAEKARALEEFRRRAEQLEAIKKRFEVLRAKLSALTKLGLSVTVRNNRMVIQ